MKTFPIFLRIFLFGYFLAVQQLLSAGPPYFTDDPDPVQYQHWEFYISSQSVFNQRTNYATGTLPHFEVNYGVIPNVQLHTELPVNYNYSSPHYMTFGYSNTEFGIKYRFVKENQNCPEIGIFPIVEIPTLNNTEFGNGSVQIYLPIWIQKSWGKFTTYGGGGYWINPGVDNINWFYAGWQAQYDFSKVITLGTEIYYHSKDAKDSRHASGITIGGSLNFTEKCHFIFSVGHSILNDNYTTSYVGLLWTI
jgi:hypothetical protein